MQIDVSNCKLGRFNMGILMGMGMGIMIDVSMECVTTD